MFKNTSSKIKIVAIVLFAVCAIIAIVVGIFKIVGYARVPNEVKNASSVELWTGIAFIIVGPFLSYVIALGYYGLGQLIDNQTHHILQVRKIDKKLFPVETDQKSEEHLRRE